MRKKVQIFRMLVQLSILALVTYLAFMHQIKGGGPEGSPNIHSICPFGALETMYRFLAEHSFVLKTNLSNLVLLAGTILITFLFGRYFCSFICALGTLQEIFEKIGKALFKKSFTVPKSIDFFLRKIKYLVLMITLYLTWKTGTLIINDYDPFAAYAHIPAGFEELIGEYIIGFSILIISLISSMFVERTFCKYLCPLGAFLAIIKKISFFKIERDRLTCINCKKCSRVCPSNIQVAEKHKIKKSECIDCFQCLSNCPTEKNSLSTKLFDRKFNFVLVALLGVMIYFAVIALANATGYWKQVPSTIEEALEAEPENIRGWMTLEDVSKELNIGLGRLYKELGIDQEEIPSNIKLKEMDDLFEEKGIDLDHEKIKDHIVETFGNAKVNSNKFIFRGKMTLDEISKLLNTDKEKLIEDLELPEDIKTDKALKDLSEEYDFDIEEIREKLEK